MGAGDGSRTVVVVVDRDGDGEMVVGYVDGLRPDLSLVDALARLQLAARRLGFTVGLRGDPCPALCELLDLVGLADVVVGACGLPLESDREAEHGEQLGIEEMVEPGDPAV